MLEAVERSRQPTTGEHTAAGGLRAAATGCRVSTDEIERAGSLAVLFGRPGPFELEIGCGKGRFIIRSAETWPERAFLAVERAKRYLMVAVQRSERRRLDNLKLIRADALEVLGGLIPPAELSAVHVLFPDPWPKKRHHKRRLFQASFLQALEVALTDGGMLNVATDHGEYFEQILEMMSGRGLMRRLEGFWIAGRLPEGEIGHTNYEVKYRKGGRKIFEASWERQPR